MYSNSSCLSITDHRIWLINGSVLESSFPFSFGIICDLNLRTLHPLDFGRKAMTKLDSILRSRGITLLTNFYVVKAVVFPVVMYECESWTIEKAVAKELMLLNCSVGGDS